MQPKSRPKTSSAGRDYASTTLKGIRGTNNGSKARGVNLLVLKSQESAEIPRYQDERKNNSNSKLQANTMSRSSKLKPLSLKDDEPPTLYEALTPKQLDADFCLQPHLGGRESDHQKRSQVRSSGTRADIPSGVHS